MSPHLPHLSRDAHDHADTHRRASAAGEEDASLPAHAAAEHHHHHHHHEEEHHGGSFDEDLHLFHETEDSHYVPEHLVHKSFEVAAVAEAKLEHVIHVLVTLYSLALFEMNKRPDLHIVAILRVFVGLLLCFFGGLFSSLVALLEAFHQGGGKQLRDNIVALHEAVHTIKIKEDDPTHIRTVMRVDPALAQQSLMGLYSATMSALVAVKLHNGRLFALGSSVGEHIDRPVQKYIVPSLVLHASPEAATWIPLVTHLAARFAGVVICAPLQKYLGILATSIRGAHMIFDGGEELVRARGGEPNVVTAELVIGGILATGMAFQLSLAMPVAVKMLLSPLLAVEWALTSAITIV